MSVRTLSGAGVIAACVAFAPPVAASQLVRFDIPASSLDRALVSFARQARVSIDVDNPDLRAVRVRGLNGRYTVRGGLRQLLDGTGYRFTLSSSGVVRVFRARTPSTRTAPARRREASPAARPVVAPRPEPLPPPPPIVVTASKQNTALADYPGSIQVADFDLIESMRFGSRGSELVLRELPNLSSTDLGSGRNKIFIRGVADSSFNGQTQSTISQYLGESRLTYSAPDPDLALYDVAAVEIVEGPQGTLYGAGSLGGVIRTQARNPEIGATEFAGVFGPTLTGASAGGDIALMANIPVNDRAAARFVAYGIRRPGYIDDLERQVEDVNRTTIAGLRATVRLEPANNFLLDIGVVGQNTRSRDSQYTDLPGSVLARRSRIAQPFANDYRLAFVTGQGGFGDVELVTNTSWVDHAIDTVFDATPEGTPDPLRFEEDIKVSLITHETRVSGSFGPVSSWVAGISAARNINNIERALGGGSEPDEFTSIRSETFDAALFGEASLEIAPRLSVTAGGRLSYIRQIEEFAAPFDTVDLEPKQKSVRFLPTAAIAWKPAAGMIVYSRYQEGFRPGALQLIGTGDEASASRFEPDELRTIELGARFGTRRGARLSGGATFSYTRWNDVQADLVSRGGFPYVANVGAGYVRYASLDLSWKPVDRLTLEASGFLATSHLDDPEPAFANADERDLPNIADSGWRVSAIYEPDLWDVPLSINGSLGYTGTSYLAIGQPFEFPQGDYLEAAAGARAELGAWGVSLDIDNVLDSRANRFSYGNPFSLVAGNQRTPLRPRTIRLGVDVRF